MKLIAILLFLLCSSTHALSVQWLGTTCIAITAQDQTILFDPFFDRPSVLETISPFSYESSEQVTKKWLSKLKSSRKDDPPFSHILGILISHAHYDHILDAPHVLKLSSAQFFGSQTALQTVSNKNIDPLRLHEIQEAKSFTIGNFKITAYKGIHPPHLFGMTLADGKLHEPLEKPASMYRYKMGEVYNFVIEHPEAKIIFYPSAYYSKDTPVTQADLLILGIANRRSSKELISKVVIPSKARFLLPVHHDDLFKKLDHNTPSTLFPFDFQEWKNEVKSQNIKIKQLELNYAEIFSIP